MEPLRLVLESVSHRYPGARKDVPSPVSAVIEPGEKCLLEGAVGTGKTTLLLRIAGLRQGPGRVIIGGQVIEGRTTAIIQRGIGYLWQNPEDGLFLPGVLDDAALGPVNDGLSSGEARAAAMKGLESAGAAHLAMREIATLSRGERQLVALAGILARDPGLILLDEPFSALDESGRERVIRVLASHRATVLLATHEAPAALGLHGFKKSVRLGQASGL